MDVDTVALESWYKTARWRRLRLEIFKRDDYTCKCGCGLIEGDTSQLVADHKIPHRGDERLFWDEDTICRRCVSRVMTAISSAQSSSP